MTKEQTVAWDTYKAVIFDLDGVIIESEFVHFQSYQEAFKAFGYTLTHEQYQTKMRSRGRSYGLKAVLSDVKETVRQSIGQKKDELFRKKMSEQPVIYKDAMELINHLIVKDKQMAIATGSANGGYILEQLKMNDFFNVIMTGKDVVKNKPDPEIFLRCIEELKVSSDQAVVIEDSEVGVKAALTAGLDVIYVHRDVEDIVNPTIHNNKITHVRNLYNLVE